MLLRKRFVTFFLWKKRNVTDQRKERAIKTESQNHCSNFQGNYLAACYSKWNKDRSFCIFVRVQFSPLKKVRFAVENNFSFSIVNKYRFQFLMIFFDCYTNHESRAPSLMHKPRSTTLQTCNGNGRLVEVCCSLKRFFLKVVLIT